MASVKRIKGNSKRNILRGTAGQDVLLGYGGNDRLLGRAKGDRLRGHGGNDFMNGGKGIDVMIGNAGNDTYVVNHLSDQVKEQADQGIDTVRASINYTLGANLENLILLGAENLNATGNGLANTITGNNGNNVLDGLAGADTMIGGLGNDTYFVDNENDVVIELENGGTDTVKTTVSKYTRPVNVEFLEYIGTGSFTATGSNTNNNITSGTGNDAISGGSGNDTINSGAGNDLLDGGLGIDDLIGGLGNDTFVVNDAGDLTEETLDSGIDLVRSTVDHVLQDNLENLELIGGNLNGKGNDLANTIIGTAGDNLLNGGAGDDSLLGGDGVDKLIGGTGLDTLTGGSGADVFGFKELGQDLITDFNNAEDKIGLDKTAFGLAGTAGQALNPTDFTSVASDAIAQLGLSSSKILYSAESGKLFFDENGILPGLGSGGQIATVKDALGQVPALSSANFIVDTIV